MPEEEQKDINKLMLDLIKKRVKANNPARKTRLLSIKINAAYLCGEQNLHVIGGALKEIPSKFPEHTKVRANKIWPAVVHDIAVSTKTNPTFDIIPAGTDEDDKATAKACDKIFPYIQRINDPHLHRKAVVMWYDLDGIGWRKVYWNPYHKAVGENPLPTEEGHNPNLKPLEPIFQGEVILEPVPNNELIWDFRLKDPRKLPWIIHNKTITLGEVAQRFGKEVADSIPEAALHDNIEPDDSFEIKVMGKLHNFSQVYASTDKTEDLLKTDKLINYYEFWHIIDKNMPQGAYAIALGDMDEGENAILVENRPYPAEQYPHKELPFIPAAPLNLDGILSTAPPIISQARPLQKEYNSIRTMIWDTSDAMGNCVLIAARDANIDYKKLDNCNANIIEVEGAYAKGAVDRQAGVPHQAGIFAHLQTILDDLNELFAFHEPSKGKMPEGGPKSAIGLQVLKEGDDTQLSPVVIGFDRADERVVYQALTLAVANYGERLIQIVGKDNQWVLDKINADELKGKINVIVRTGSSLPINNALEMEKTIFAWQSGLLGNPQDPNIRQKVLKAMDLGSFEQILQDNAKQINFAQKEFINAEKLLGQMPPLEEGAVTINPKTNKMDFADEYTENLILQYLYVPPVNDGVDDHYIHIQEHTNYQVDKWFDFMAMGAVYQALAWAMRAHTAQHQQILMQQQLMMLRMENPSLFKEEKDVAESKKK